ncbi:hypothetical protein CDA63_17015 [Hymenobacter amundsenii]|uniref:Uncharacterized protein n=1 Tax=Hymenobacter amundsenii TaxID=2006685 RepID=A0A246FH71_9BACT|nr:hypothetical protein CDA63_17015 [Hymenobacter amundsenii]
MVPAVDLWAVLQLIEDEVAADKLGQELLPVGVSGFLGTPETRRANKSNPVSFVDWLNAIRRNAAVWLAFATVCRSNGNNADCYHCFGLIAAQ